MTGPVPVAQLLAGNFLGALETRVQEEQGGVATFADTAHRHIIAALRQLPATRDWNVSLDEALGPEAAALKEEWHRIALRIASGTRGRFRDYGERVAEGAVLPNFRRSDVPDHVMWSSQGVEECLRWNGIPLFKSAFDFALYPMIVHDLKPGAIIEIGAGNGASAAYLAHCVRASGLGAPVISVDIRPPALDEPGVRFIAGDAHDLGAALDESLLAALPKPWLVIEDAHVALDLVFGFFDERLAAGDYLMIEDSIGKDEAIRALVGRDAGRYRIDTRYTDFFGRNATSAVDSILRREK